MLNIFFGTFQSLWQSLCLCWVSFLYLPINWFVLNIFFWGLPINLFVLNIFFVPWISLLYLPINWFVLNIFFWAFQSICLCWISFLYLPINAPGVENAQCWKYFLWPPITKSSPPNTEYVWWLYLITNTLILFHCPHILLYVFTPANLKFFFFKNKTHSGSCNLL